MCYASYIIKCQACYISSLWFVAFLPVWDVDGTVTYLLSCCIIICMSLCNINHWSYYISFFCNVSICHQCVLYEFIPEIMFRCYRCLFDVFAVSTQDMSSLCVLYLVWSLVVVCIFLIQYWPNGSCFTALSLSHHCRPYKTGNRSSESIIVLQCSVLRHFRAI